MNVETAMEGGITGATTLTILHEIVRKLDKDAPRLDEIGKEALGKLFKKLNLDVPDDDKMRVLATGAELISNGLFYSLVGAAGKNNVYLRGIFLGLTAGIAAVALPGKLGLDESASNRTDKTKILTVAWYVIGGVVAAAVTERLEERRRKYNR
jgi:hypothetical protein